MRILLAQNSLYYPAHGGGDKSNRLLIEALAARGHECRVVARIPVFGEAEHSRYLAELAARGVEAASGLDGVVVFRREGVEIHVATNQPHLRAYFSSQIEAFDPDVILASTDDPAQLLLEAALKAERARVVYLVRATLAVPFGPDCAFPSASKTDMLRRADAVVGVSQYVADYIRRYSGIPAVHVPISLMEPGPWPELGRFDNEFITLVNPCAVKGIDIFVALADAFPQLTFAAVPTWGTNARDRDIMLARPNMRLLDPVDDIDRLLERTRVLLVPSLWAEARSRIVLEAMLRGVPVMASNTGGIPEAKMGVEYLFPVRQIEHYQTRVDEQMVPLADVPPQDIGPWTDALRRLTTDRAHYEDVARRSRKAALDYARDLNAEPFERILEETVRAPRRPRSGPDAAAETLSADKRRLLALLVRKKAAAQAWFPNLDARPHARLRLFCLPHAGGGAAAYHRWIDQLAPGIAVCPVRLPGRESRTAEPPFTRMEPLVEALADAISPHTAQPFAFFGHSMGAGIAFELARALRKRGQRMPVRLIVSGGRAPRCRIGWKPPADPTRAELLAQLRQLDGIPREALENEDLLRMILPALEADTTLYRHYAYHAEPPLDCHIHALGGERDPNVTPEHLALWAGETTREFEMHVFAGGHFYLQTHEAELISKLREIL